MSIVSFDTSRVDRMLQRIEDRARAGWADEVLAVAESGAAQVSGISDPGLAASVHGTLGRRPGKYSALVVSDEREAAFVFAASPPSIPAAGMAADLAQRIFEELFR